jgi:hypothetical protein
VTVHNHNAVKGNICDVSTATNLFFDDRTVLIWAETAEYVTADVGDRGCAGATINYREPSGPSAG